MISARSKASHFNGDNSDDHIPEAAGDSFERDEIGLVRAICIKVSALLLPKELVVLTAKYLVGAFLITAEGTVHKHSSSTKSSCG